MISPNYCNFAEKNGYGSVFSVLGGLSYVRLKISSLFCTTAAFLFGGVAEDILFYLTNMVPAPSSDSISMRMEWGTLPSRITA